MSVCCTEPRRGLIILTARSLLFSLFCMLFSRVGEIFNRGIPGFGKGFEGGALGSSIFMGSSFLRERLPRLIGIGLRSRGFTVCSLADCFRICLLSVLLLLCLELSRGGERSTTSLFIDSSSLRTKLCRSSGTVRSDSNNTAIL